MPCLAHAAYDVLFANTMPFCANCKVECTRSARPAVYSTHQTIVKWGRWLLDNAAQLSPWHGGMCLPLHLLPPVPLLVLPLGQAVHSEAPCTAL